jgi:hypothetical protein
MKKAKNNFGGSPTGTFLPNNTNICLTASKIKLGTEDNDRRNITPIGPVSQKRQIKDNLSRIF